MIVHQIAMARMLIGAVVTTLAPAATLFAADPPIKPGQVVTNGIGMKLIGIPAGEFMQGISGDQDAEAIESEQPAHWVKISKPFYIGVYEVTQKEYRAVMSKSPWTESGGRHPASFCLFPYRRHAGGRAGRKKPGTETLCLFPDARQPWSAL